MRLDKSAEESLHFRDGTYRWAWLVTFECTEVHASPADVFDALISDRWYCGFGIGSPQDLRELEDPDSAGPGHHGPFPMSAISPSSFVRIDQDAALGQLREFGANEDGSVDPKIASRYEDFVEAITASRSQVFKLALDESDHHDWGWVIDPFLEQVAIDWDAGRVLLLIAGAD